MDQTISNDIDIDPKNDEALLEESEAFEQAEEESSVDDDEVAKLRSENKKLTEIIKRRKERETKESLPEQKSTNNAQVLSRDEAILIASGLSGDDLDYLNVVAKGTGLPIGEAKEHPLFTTYLDKIADEKKARRAKLGASRGSSTHKPVDMAGLSEAEHRKIWAQKLGM